MLIIKMAYRNLWRNKGRTALTVLVMVISSSMLMVTIGLLNGMVGELIASNTDQYTGHIQITKGKYSDDRDFYQSFDRYREVMDKVEGSPEVLAAAPRLRSFGLLSFENNTTAVEMLGIEPKREKRVTKLDQSLISGTFLSGPNEAVIGSVLARRLEAKVGSQLVYVTTAADGSIGNDLLTVTGIFKTGNQDYDRSLALVSLPWLADLLVYFKRIHEIALRIRNANAAVETAQKIALMVRDYSLTVEPWQDILPVLNQAINFYRMEVWVILLVFYLGAGLGIMNTFFMTVYERTREFGVMLTLGMTPGGIRKVMITEAFFMGGVSMLLGGAVGLVLVALLFFHGLDFSFWLTPVTYFGSTIRPVFYTKITWQGIIYPMIFLVVTSVVSVYFPAWRASRLDPVKAMRKI